MNSLLLASAAIPAFAAIDRLWGAPRGKTAAKVLAGLTIGGLFLLDWRYAAMGAAIVAGRSVGFADGVATGKNPAGLLMRSVIPLAATFVITGLVSDGKGFDLNVLATASMVPHAVATILLAFWYGHRIDAEPWNVQRALDDNHRLELTRGAFAGLGVALYAVTRVLG